MVTYEIIYDIVQDAYNWFNAINSFHQEKKLNNIEDQEIAKKIRGLTFSESKGILIPYLKERNKKSALSPEHFKEVTSDQLNKNFELAIKKLEQVTKHPLAIENCAKNRMTEVAKVSKQARCSNKDLLFLITTFPAMIVYYEEGVIYIYAKIDDELWGMPLDGILHELMHFQTDFYYRQNPDSIVAKLSEDDYFILKESLTVLLDKTWKPLITLPDCSYPEYQPLRDKLSSFYYKYEDFDKLMDYGATEVRQFSSEFLKGQ